MGNPIEAGQRRAVRLEQHGQNSAAVKARPRSTEENAFLVLVQYLGVATVPRIGLKEHARSAPSYGEIICRCGSKIARAMINA